MSEKLRVRVHPYGIGFEGSDDLIFRLGWWWEVEGPGFSASGKTRRRHKAEEAVDAAIERFAQVRKPCRANGSSR